MLMNWAVDQLDSKGLRGMLEASVVAARYKLYDKYGFRSIDEHTYADPKRFPNAKPVSLVTMVRDVVPGRSPSSN